MLLQPLSYASRKIDGFRDSIVNVRLLSGWHVSVPFRCDCVRRDQDVAEAPRERMDVFGSAPFISPARTFLVSHLCSEPNRSSRGCNWMYSEYIEDKIQGTCAARGRHKELTVLSETERAKDCGFGASVI